MQTRSQPQRGCVSVGPEPTQPRWGRNLSFASPPRVGRRGDQPWARGQNPVGVCASDRRKRAAASVSRPSPLAPVSYSSPCARAAPTSKPLRESRGLPNERGSRRKLAPTLPVLASAETPNVIKNDSPIRVSSRLSVRSVAGTRLKLDPNVTRPFRAQAVGHRRGNRSAARSGRRGRSSRRSSFPRRPDSDTRRR